MIDRVRLNHYVVTSTSGETRQLLNKSGDERCAVFVFWLHAHTKWIITCTVNYIAEKKPTDRNTILQGNSFHSTSLIKALPISQFHRAKRICIMEQLYACHAADIADRFLSRANKRGAG